MVSHEFNTVYEVRNRSPHHLVAPWLRPSLPVLVAGRVNIKVSKSAVEEECPHPGYANDNQRACQRNPESCGGFPKDLYFGKIRGLDASFGEIDMLSAVVDILLWILGNVAAPLRWYHTCIGSERGRERTKAVY